MSRAHDDDADGVEVSLAIPGAFDSAEELARLRNNAFASVGRPYAGGILYGIGVAQGLTDGLRVARRFATALNGAPRHAGAGLPILFQAGRMQSDRSFAGLLGDSIEAAVHLRDLGADAGPVCHVSAGYCAGWYSALLGSFQLVREVACVAHGADACRFETRPVEAWLEANDAWATTMLAYLDFESMRHEAAQKAAESPDESEGSMMGAFDPLSPAVHVWGPVMVLPYSGAGDSLEAVGTILGDVGPGALRVIVLDLTGARIEELEATGLLRVLEILEGHKLETVLVGVPERVARSWLARSAALSLPLRASDITEGISLAFQLARFV